MMINEHNKLIGFRVYDAQRSLSRALEIALEPYGITPGQFNLLSQLDRAGQLSQKALAELTRKEQATITRYLDVLERKNLVRRAKDQNDRRAHVVSTTDDARALLETVTPVAVDAANYLIRDIEQDDIDTFLTVLATMKGNADRFSNGER